MHLSSSRKEEDEEHKNSADSVFVVVVVGGNLIRETVLLPQRVLRLECFCRSGGH